MLRKPCVWTTERNYLPRQTSNGDVGLSAEREPDWLGQRKFAVFLSNEP
jgi:hypothetical protein